MRWARWRRPWSTTASMYAMNGRWTYAIDVATGRQIWRTPVQIEPGMNAPDQCVQTAARR